MKWPSGLADDHHHRVRLRVLDLPEIKIMSSTLSWQWRGGMFHTFKSASTAFALKRLLAARCTVS